MIWADGHFWSSQSLDPTPSLENLQVSPLPPCLQAPLSCSFFPPGPEICLKWKSALTLQLQYLFRMAIPSWSGIQASRSPSPLLSISTVSAPSSNLSLNTACCLPFLCHLTLFSGQHLHPACPLFSIHWLENYLETSWKTTAPIIIHASITIQSSEPSGPSFLEISKMTM